LAIAVGDGRLDVGGDDLDGGRAFGFGRQRFAAAGLRRRCR
jgi:hypothetical protein